MSGHFYTSQWLSWHRRASDGVLWVTDFRQSFGGRYVITCIAWSEL